MLVVCDTSPICYAILIGEVDLLQQLFGEIQIPHAVHDELDADASPSVVRSWIRSPPDWLRIVEAPVDFPPQRPGLHPGEIEVLALAHQRSADLTILDDLAARRAAATLGLRVVGLLGLLDRAASQGLLDLEPALERLTSTNFRVSPSLVQTLLDRHR